MLGSSCFSNLSILAKFELAFLSFYTIYDYVNFLDVWILGSINLEDKLLLKSVEHFKCFRFVDAYLF